MSGMAGHDARHERVLCGHARLGEADQEQGAAAVPAIVGREEFERVQELLKSRTPQVVHPRRAASPYIHRH